jgi:alpha-L-fucosidase
LNIGPTPEGRVRTVHTQRLLEIGNWMRTYGSAIYGTSKSLMKPAEWGVAVEKGNTVYLHILYPDKLKNQLNLPGFPYKIQKAVWFESGQPVKFSNNNTGEISLLLPGLKPDAIDQIITINTTTK